MAAYETSRQAAVQRRQAGGPGRSSGTHNGHDVGAQLSQNAAFKAQMLAVQRKVKPPIAARTTTPIGGRMPKQSGLHGVAGLRLTSLFMGEPGHAFEFRGVQLSIDGTLRATQLDFSQNGSRIGGTAYLNGAVTISLLDEHSAVEVILGAGGEALFGTSEAGGSVGYGTDIYLMNPFSTRGLPLDALNQRLGVVSAAAHFNGQMAGVRHANDSRWVLGDGGDDGRSASQSVFYRGAPGGAVDGVAVNNQIVNMPIDNREAARFDPTNVRRGPQDGPRGTYIPKPGPLQTLSKGELTLQLDFDIDGQRLGIESGMDSEAIRDAIQNGWHGVINAPDVPLVRQAAQHILRMHYQAGGR